MTEPVSVVIPVQRGTEWNQERAASLPTGTPYLVVEHDDGEWPQAVNDGVRAAQTPLVLLSAADAWHERNPEALEFLADLAWDADVTYGQLFQWENGQPKALLAGEMFCPNRLRRENYLPSVACVRREKFLQAGGVQSGLWDLWLRMLEAGAKFKYVPEACSARDGTWKDPSPTPTPVDVRATFYYQATPGTAYWRCLLPARYLPGQSIFNGPALLGGRGQVRFPQHQGTAVIQYAGDESHHELVLALKAQGYRTLVEVDDTYAHWFPQVMNKAGWSEHKGEGRFSVEQHRETVQAADGVIVTTGRLAKQYRPLNPNVFVCPNQIDPADWSEPAPRNEKFWIGWFASASHRGDGDLIRRALEWASRQKDVEVVLVGVGADNGKPWYKFPFKHCPWSNDFGVYRRFLSELDIGLAPVTGTPWAVNRSDLKALEYGMVGAYPVVSDQPPYKTVDVPKAKTPKDFLRIIQSLVNDRDGTRKLAREWREYVVKERTVQANINLWEQAICQT